MDYEIRKALPSDAEQLLEFLKIVGSETDNLSFGKEGLSISIEQEQAYIQSILDSSSSLMLVVTNDNQIVANASFNCNSKERLKHRGEISIVVRKSCWGKGIGSKLMDHIIDFVKHNTVVSIISLEVRSDNTRAINMYKKYGFKTIGTFKGFLKVRDQYIDFDLMNLYL